MDIKKITIICTLGFLCVVSFVAFINYRHTPPYASLSGVTLIAHAGGGIGKGNYTNSLEALDSSVERGLRYIEVDFMRLDDGSLILLHDLEATYRWYFSPTPEILSAVRRKMPPIVTTADEFKALNMRKGLTQMTLSDLLVWMDENPGIFIITDFKGENYLSSLKAIQELSATLQWRFIPQIYQFSDYDVVKELGYTKIIFTAYRLKTPIGMLVEFSQSHELFGLTLPQHRITESNREILGQSKVPIFTHTINDVETAQSLMDLGVSGFYTDYLFPEHNQN